MNSSLSVCTIIVTFNRAALLKQCIGAILHQTVAPEHILIIDNGSTDDTNLIIKEFQSCRPTIRHIRLNKNIGGSGGFHEGMRSLMIDNFRGWIWLMDDDALPEPNALEELLKFSQQTKEIYASSAVNASGNSSALCWPAKHLVPDQRFSTLSFHKELPSICKVASVPFLGFFIHTSLVNTIGLPKRDFFISGDDTEYSMRARKAGVNINLVASSIIQHPLPSRLNIQLPGAKIAFLLLPPWKRYYDTRNRILIAKRYFGAKLFTQTLPGTFLRWLLALIHQKQRAKQTLAFIKGTIDGLAGRTGIRWIPGK